MTSIGKRVAKLERELGNVGKGRIIAVRSSGASTEQVDAFLASQGVAVDHRKDQVVHLCTLFLDRSENPIVADIPQITLLNITEMRR